jgi:hypothetical protein
MDKNREFLEDGFNLDEFHEEFGKIIEEHYYKKNKVKFDLLYFLIMLASVAVAFLLYTVLQNYINTLTI